MISKVNTGESIAGLCKYVFGDKERVEVIDSNGVCENEYVQMAKDFQLIMDLRPSKVSNVFHGILAFPKNETPDAELLKSIANEYLAELGIVNTPFIIAKHKDKEHVHLHVIASLVDFDGKSISTSYLGLKGKKVAQKLTLKYGLTPADSKDLSKTNFKALHKKERAKYELLGKIKLCLKHSTSFDHFLKLLEESGVKPLIKYKRGTQEYQGISFEYGEFKFKGSEIDRNFSIHKLMAHFKSEVSINTSIERHNKSSESSTIIVSNNTNNNVATPLLGSVLPSSKDDDDDYMRKKKKGFNL